MLDGNMHIHGHDRRFSEGSGIIGIDDATRDKVLQAFKSYLETLPDPRRQTSYDVKDVVARRGVAIGSAGLPTYSKFSVREDVRLCPRGTMQYPGITRLSLRNGLALDAARSANVPRPWPLLCLGPVAI